MRGWFWVAAAVALPFLFGCTTMRWSDYRQDVLIRSHPDGARVYRDGHLVGTTPLWLPVRRGRESPTFTLVSRAGETQTLIVPGKYRASESLYPGLIFLPFAPVAWGLDLVTGTAFEFRTPPAVVFSKDPVERLQARFERIAIAPPVMDDEELSDETGVWLRTWLRRKYPRAVILPYRDTALEFEWAGIHHDRVWEPEKRPNFMAEWNYWRKVTEVAFASVDMRVDPPRLTVELRRHEDAASVARYEEDLPVQEIAAIREESWARRLGALLAVVPNNVGLDFGRDEPAVTVDGIDYSGRGEREPGVWGDIGAIVGGLHLGHIDGPTRRQSWKMYLQFVPQFTFRYGRVSFPSLPGAGDREFRRLSGFAGYGPQVGVVSRWGQAYVNVLVGGSYTRLDWQGPGGHRETDQTDLTVGAEIGYLVYLDRNFNVRVFARSTGEDDEAWREAIRDATGNRFLFVERPELRYVGVSFGYYIPERRHPGRWLMGDGHQVAGVRAPPSKEAL